MKKLPKRVIKSGYPFMLFSRKNDDPETLMQVAEWWIKTHQLDHFEKASKIKQMIENE